MSSISQITLVFLAGVMSVSCEDEKPNGNKWVKDDGNPILRKDQPYDFIALSDCWVVYDDDTYKVWYTSGGYNAPDTVLHSSISYATSMDGVNWVKYVDNPVLDITKTEWDSLGVETVTVLVDVTAPASSRFKLWYAGQTVNDVRYDIGYAYSADGISWTKHPQAVLTVGNSNSWDNCFIEGPSVIKEGASFKMWYAGYDCVVNNQETDGKANIGYATSSDGINWTKYAGNPILKVSPGTWDGVFVSDPHVLFHNGLYHMWYGGTDKEDNFYQQTGYAYSSDGITWIKSSRPVLTSGASGEWDANTASFPSVMILGDRLKMWYTGKDVHPLPEYPAPYYWEIGFAEKALPQRTELE